METHDKTKDELIKELQELHKKYNSLKKLYDNIITKSILTEEELRENQELFRKALDLGVVGMATTHPYSFYFLSANKQLCEMVGYTEEELMQKTWAEITFPKEKVDEDSANVLKLLNGEVNGYVMEKQYQHKDGRMIDITLSVQGVTKKDGSIDYILILVDDITQRKQAERELIKANKELTFQNAEKEKRAAELIIAREQAEQSDRLKSAFLSNMSHEIRTPMNGILGFAELLKEPNLSGEEQQEYIKIIEKSGSRMLNIINNIVDVSKIEAGLVKIDIKDTNINEKIEFIYNLFKPQVEEKGMQLLFRNTLPAKEATIKTDNEKVYSILSNLVNNAIKYTNEGKIEYGYAKKGDYLEFYVNDNGIGIPKERQEAIFERFIQADISDVQARQGAGLGLSIAKAYVEMLGGKIWVESEPDKGSTFYFTLPYHIEQNEKSSVRKVVPPESVKKLIENLKILIAEDDEASKILISKAVNDFSREIIEVETGIEAVEICRKHPDIDLILMDIQMPHLNGHEATRQIRIFNKDVAIIAHTAFELAGDREKSIEAGCNDYITKPINRIELLSIMQKHLLTN
jgi:hypothetical protein